jgi:acetyl-CoA synthetase
MQTDTTKEILQLREDDVFWCTADPGWVTGSSYGIIGPCSLGVSQICYEGGMNVRKWFEILEQEQVTVWYTAPTALRMIMQESTIDFNKYDLSKLRSVFSVGEPLNPEILQWSRTVLKKDIYDTYFQTETGTIMIANRPGYAIKPGSMGVPVDKIKCEILDDEDNMLSCNKPGNLCIKAPWESMFITYLNNPQVYQEKFKSGYYYTGDQAYRTKDGYFWFIGRIDDIINTAGHLVSPFEVESAILEMEQISDVAVIGAPDSILFEKVVAYVKVNSDLPYSNDLDLHIRLYVSKKISPISAPAEIIIIDKIPKNKSGKIMRRYLRALYEGKDPGDISTIDQ